MPRINDLNATTRPSMAPQPAARPLLGVARSSVGYGQLFRRYNDAGTLGEKLYASIGNNGRYYSLNLGNGEIAATDDGDARVKVVGEWSISADLGGRTAVQATNRASLNDQAVFRVKGGKKLMANLGRLNDGRYLSLNIQSHDYVISQSNPGYITAEKRAKWGRKSVEKVGTYSINFRETAARA